MATNCNRRLVASVLALVTLAACGTTVPGSGPANTQADAAWARLQGSPGGQLVLRAIEAHGGLDLWYDTPTSAFAWEYSNVGMGFRFKSYQVADNRTRDIYHELRSLGTPDKTEPTDGRFAWDGSQAWIQPATMERINPRFWATTPYYFELIPFVLADPGLRYQLLADEQLDGVAYDMVRVGYEQGVGDSPGDTYVLYVDQTTMRVRAIRYTVTYFSGKQPSDEAPTRETLFYYDEYVTVSGLTVPTRFRGFLFENGEKGAFKNDAWASEISFGGPFDSAALKAPAGARVQSPPSRP